jgi:Ca-activated chloride channel family protein
MSFDYPWLLLLLLLAVPVTLLWRNSVQKRKRRILKFTESIFSEKLLVGNHPGLRMWHFILFFSATVLLIFAISGPTISGGKEKVKSTGIDMVVVLDVSNSMRATDIQPSRIERAKLALSELITKLGTDRMGITVFAGTSFTCLPLCDDHEAADMVVQTITPEMISMQGTAIGQAIDNAAVSFMNSEKDRGKAIILISDGENHEDDAAAAAARAADNGIIVCTIGIGSAEGATIPEFDSKGNPAGNKRDENGKEIITRLDEENLKNIAKQGSGVYVHASNGDMGISKIYNMLQGLNKTTKETWRYTTTTSIFRWFLLGAILLFLAEAFLPEGKRNEFNSRKS